MRRATSAHASAHSQHRLHAMNAGGALTTAKGECQHGRWLLFLAEIGLPDRTARTWMQLARNRLRVADMSSMRQAIAALVEQVSTCDRARVDGDYYRSRLSPGAHV
jgi:hypothetical protein